jgi:limonene-1,2-epoxide hydrolase
MFSAVKVVATLALAFQAALASPDHDHQLDKRFTEYTVNRYDCFSKTTKNIDNIALFTGTSDPSSNTFRITGES